IDERQLQSFGDGGTDEAGAGAVGRRDRDCAHGPSPFDLTCSGSESRYPLAGTRSRTRSAAFAEASSADGASTAPTPMRIFAVPATGSTGRPFPVNDLSHVRSPVRPGSGSSVRVKAYAPATAGTSCSAPR